MAQPDEDSIKKEVGLKSVSAAASTKKDATDMLMVRDELEDKLDAVETILDHYQELGLVDSEDRFRLGAKIK